jgi:two-component system NtrC family response regulator
MEKPKLLIVDDDEGIRSQLKWALADAYDVFLAGDRVTAMEIMTAEKPSLVLLDLGLPPDPRGAGEGLKALGEIGELDRTAKIVIITGNNEKANALKAVEGGAFDFFVKPPDMEEVRIILKRALSLISLERENIALREKGLRMGFEDILGDSPPMQKIFSLVRKVAPSDASVLISGESGTGKELIAKAIHSVSNRQKGPFIAINCGAIPENLLESELFGHEKGSFTGADAQRKGKIEYAHEGTFFLDEIGELPLMLQVKLLRFLQEHQVERVGGRENIPVNVRIIAATNRDLSQDIQGERFREDLYYRIGVINLSIPPLRDRENDTILLAKSFLQKFSSQYGKIFKGFSSDAIAAMESHMWPGNVRELENKVKRAVIISEGKHITPGDLELEAPSEDAKLKFLKEIREETEEIHIRKALKKHDGNISRAAKELGISRPTFHDLMKKHQIVKEQ